LGKVKAHITRTAEKPSINLTSSTTKASDANDVVPGHKENGENGTTSIQPTPAPPVQKSKGSTTATTLPAEDAGPAHKRKRNDEAEDGAVLPPKSAKLSDEQKQELGKNLPLYSLLQTALERIIPCDGLQDWNRGEILSIFSPQYMNDILKVARVISFMDQCSRKSWHCVRFIVRGKASAVRNSNRRCSSCLSRCVQVSRLETDGGLGSRYYLGRVIYLWAPGK
jgi:hypothetical protein